MKYQQWSIPELPAGAVDRLTGAGYPYLVSSVLASRGITTPEEAAAFLERDRDLPYSPFLMKDMDKAAQRVSRALADGEKIAVFGDYDVDGITATVILVDYLLSPGRRRACTISPAASRMATAWERDAMPVPARAGGPPAGHGGLRHHRRGGGGLRPLPGHGRGGHGPPRVQGASCPRPARWWTPTGPTAAIPSSTWPACGVALKLVLALGGESREEALLSRYCTLAAIGTVADVMQMTGENRTIVSPGPGVHQPAGLHRPPRPAA